MFRRNRFSLSTTRLRRILSWKFLFYDLLLPVFARTRAGARRHDTRTLRPAGHVAAPTTTQAATRRAGAGSAALDADWTIESTWPGSRPIRRDFWVATIPWIACPTRQFSVDSTYVDMSACADSG